MGILAYVGPRDCVRRNVECRERKSRGKVKVNYRDSDIRYLASDFPPTSMKNCDV